MNTALLRQLCAASGVSGFERDVRTLILENLPSDARFCVDALGNLIVEKPGTLRKKRKKILLLSESEADV